MTSVRDSLSTASLFLEQYRSGFDFNGVDANILGAGSADRLAGRDMKLSLVQRAFDVLAFDEAVGEARLSVRAGVVSSEDFSAEVVQAHRFRAEVGKQRSKFSLGTILEWHCSTKNSCHSSKRSSSRQAVYAA